MCGSSKDRDAKRSTTSTKCKSCCPYGGVSLADWSMNAPSFLHRLLPTLTQAAGTADGSINRSRHGCSGMGKHETLGKARNRLELSNANLPWAGILKTLLKMITYLFDQEVRLTAPQGYEDKFRRQGSSPLEERRCRLGFRQTSSALSNRAFLQGQQRWVKGTLPAQPIGKYSTLMR